MHGQHSEKHYATLTHRYQRPAELLDVLPQRGDIQRFRRDRCGGGSGIFKSMSTSARRPLPRSGTGASDSVAGADSASQDQMVCPVKPMKLGVRFTLR